MGIISEKVKIHIRGSQIPFYKSLGIECRPNEEIEIDILNLNTGSHIKIDASCDVCGTIKNVPYRRYLKSVTNGGYYSCSSKCGQAKVKNTSIIKYGKEHHLQSEKVKEKIKNTFIKKYGVNNYHKSEDYKLKIPLISEKYLKTRYEKLINSKENNIIAISGDSFLCKCNIHGDFLINKSLYSNRVNNKTNNCILCFPINENRSIKEKDLLNYIKSIYNGIIIENYKMTNRKEIDIYLPDLKIGLEFNGLHWHSSEYIEDNYHLNKTLLAEEDNIRLIHVFEDDWDNNRIIIESMLSNLINKNNTRIFARKCELVTNITTSEIRSFLNNNHLQGFVVSKFDIGLKYENELISIMTFGKLRKSLGYKGGSNDNWELLRYATKLGVNVIGGASKLLKYFTKNNKNSIVTSYANRDWSIGNLYNKLNFKFEGFTKPGYHYVVNGKRINRYNYRKDILVSEGFDKNKTEREIMATRKIYRIYNTGNLKYILDTTKCFSP